MPAQITSLLTALRRMGCTPAEAVALAILTIAAAAIVGLLWLGGREPTSGVSVEAPTEVASGAAGVVLSEGEVIVHVAGAVSKPGVYTLAGGSRVGDALNAAGGAKRRAVLDGLNLARPLTDGEQVLVPAAAASASDAGAASVPAVPSSPGLTGASPAAVSLNTATVADLETLPGIGPVLAERIISHRDSVGGFKEVGELRDVPGIGEKTFQSLAPLVSL